MMKSILTTIAFLALAVSGLAQTRSVIVNTSGVIQSPTNFWSANATNARSGLGLGTAATNPATAFQPSSSVLTNLANNNGSTLTNISAAGVVGILATNGNGAGLTNLTAANITGAIAISNGGSGATTAGGARTNLGLGATNDVEFQTVKINLSTGAGDSLIVTNSGSSATSLFDDITVNELDAETAAFGNTVIVSSNGISFNTNTAAATTRTNLGLGLSALTNTSVSNFSTAIGLGVTNVVTNRALVLPQADGLGSSTAYGIQWRNIYPSSNGLIALSGTDDQGQTTFRISTGTMSGTTAEVALFNANQITFYEPLSFNNTTNAATTRTNFGLGWAALTNTSASGFGAALYGSNTNPVLYNTNGEVVSPTNFWQVAPIVTRFVESQPTTNQTTNITAARNLHIHSLAISTTGVTNTIALPTNNVFNGDIALVVHEGPTSSVTQVRTQGSTNNLVTMNRTEEAVEFVYYNSVWQFNHNRSFVEPIYFSGTNATANAAASRTNLGLGASKLSPTLTNITGLTSVTLESGRALEVSILSASGWGTSNIITLPTNSPQHNDIVTIFFQRSPSTAPAIVENAGGLGGPWYIYSGNEAKWIYDTNAGPARWQPLGKTVRAEINYLGDDASSTRVNLGLGEANSVTFSSLTLSSNLTLGSGDNIVLSTTTGTKIGTATNQLLGFYNQTPITQPSSTGVTTNGFTAGGGTGVHPNSTFTGGIGTNAYTISDVVAHLKSLGLLAP